MPALGTACCLQGARALGHTVSEGSPAGLSHQIGCSSAVCAAWCIPGQLPHGHHSECGVLLRVRGAVDEVWLPPAWFHRYPPDQQMELREYYFLKANKIMYPQFALLRI